MRSLSKSFTLIFILSITISGLTSIVIRPALAQSMPKLSIPEFTTKYVDHSYDVQPTYGTDPYTGKTVVTKQGEHIDNRTVEITIKNQPFTPFNDSNGNTINRFYDVRYKGSYTGNWTNMFGNQTQGVWIGQTNPYMKYGYAIQDDSAQYTTIIYQLTWQIPTNGQMDFQVEALEGYTVQTFYDGHILFANAGFTFYGQESGWSNTQTVMLGVVSIATNPTLTELPPISTPNIESPTNSTPTGIYNPTEEGLANSNQLQTLASVPFTTFLIVVTFLIGIIAVLSVLTFRRHQKTNPSQEALDNIH